MRFGRGMGRDGIVRSSRLNVIDAAYFDVASLLMVKEEYEEAVAELRKVIEGSPDADAISAAHLSAGNILRQKIGNIEEAVKEYKLVSGRYAEWATRQIVQAYEEIGETGKAIDVLKEMLATAGKPEEKVSLLRQMAEVYKKSKNTDMAIETLRKIPTVITYDEAMKMGSRYGTSSRWGGGAMRIVPAPEVRAPAGAAVRPMERKEKPKL